MKNNKTVYKDSKAICACGVSFDTKSTVEEIHVEICSECHPFYTGKQSSTTKKGSVEKFNKRYGLKKQGD